MKYCPSCGSEYRDDIARCEECGGIPLLTQNEMKGRGLLLPGEVDERRFAVAGTAEDPLLAERLTQALEGERIPVLCRPKRGGTVDVLTTASLPWWEISVPQELVERAQAVLAQARSRLESGAAEAAKAAEEEEAETEGRQS